MATRLAWWTIPATVVVLVRVVTLPGESPVDSVVAPLPPVAAAPYSGDPSMSSDTVVLRDAAGVRSGPFELPKNDVLILELPVSSQRVDFTLRRYLRENEEPSLWLHGNPRVRSDGTMPIYGLPAGRYAVAIEWQEGDAILRIERSEITVPGTIDLRR